MVRHRAFEYGRGGVQRGRGGNNQGAEVKKKTLIMATVSHKNAYLRYFVDFMRDAPEPTGKAKGENNFKSLLAHENIETI